MSTRRVGEEWKEAEHARHERHRILSSTQTCTKTGEEGGAGAREEERESERESKERTGPADSLARDWDRLEGLKRMPKRPAMIFLQLGKFRSGTISDQSFTHIHNCTRNVSFLLTPSQVLFTTPPLNTLSWGVRGL